MPMQELGMQPSGALPAAGATVFFSLGACFILGHGGGGGPCSPFCV